MPARAATTLLGIPSSHRITSPDPHTVTQAVSRRSVKSQSCPHGPWRRRCRMPFLHTKMLDLRQITSLCRPLCLECASDCAPISAAASQVASKVPKYLTIRTHTSTSHPTTASLRLSVPCCLSLSSYCFCPHTPPHCLEQSGSFIIFYCPSQPISCLDHSTYTPAMAIFANTTPPTNTLFRPDQTHPESQ
jgi:hypothetical protein